MKSKIKPQTNEFVQAIGELAAAQQQLARQAEQQYSFEVASILRDQCCESRHIECLLERMLDFCFDDEMLRLYKKSSAVITSKLIKRQRFRMSMHIVKCEMMKDV